MEEEKPKYKSVRENGNVFNTIGRASAKLKRAGQRDKAEEFTKRAFASHSYDKVLAWCWEWGSRIE